MSDIVLSRGVRQNLLSLQNTSDLVGLTQNRLATGKRVNSALDNPTNFFTASALNSRGSELRNLLDSMSNAIKTLEAADNGMKAITKVVESMQATVRQARQDKTTGPITPGVALTTGTTNTSTATANKITFTVGGADVDIATFAGTAVRTNAQIVNDINSSSALSGKVKATVVGASFTLENLTTTAIATKGMTGTAVNGVATNVGTLAAGTAVPSDVRKALVSQFNDLRTQLDKLSTDAGYNGTNLLAGDKLKVIFNEKTGLESSELDIQGKKSNGTAFGELSSTNLGIGSAFTGVAGSATVDFNSDAALDTLTDKLGTSLNTLRTQSSQYGSSLSTVQNRKDFTRSMINTLTSGADDLTLADSNEEGANLLSLQTRQQLSTTALSLASQADQAVLRLF